MNLDSTGYSLIKNFEGLRLDAYQDSAGIYTIGYGNITYIDGSKVKKGDKINQETADNTFKYYADRFANKVDVLITKPVTQNQFNAVVSLAYNIGIGNFSKSTLLRKLNINPNDPTIRNEFLRWVNAGGRKIQGLVNRRTKESEIYYKK